MSEDISTSKPNCVLTVAIEECNFTDESDCICKNASQTFTRIDGKKSGVVLFISLTISYQIARSEQVNCKVLVNLTLKNRSG